MRSHIQVVGILNVLWNLIGVLVGLACLLIGFGFGSMMGLAAGSQGSAGEGAALMAIVTTFGAIIGCAVLIPSLPGFIAGIALFKFRNWARIVLIIVSAINLLNFPFGTALGAYTLYVLLHRDTEAIFANPDVDPDPIY